MTGCLLVMGDLLHFLEQHLVSNINNYFTVQSEDSQSQEAAKCNPRREGGYKNKQTQSKHSRLVVYPPPHLVLSH